MEDVVIEIQMTAPDPEALADSARQLIQHRMVVSARITPGVRSLYRWESVIEDQTEAVLLLRTTPAHSDAVMDYLCDEHPNATPGIEWCEVNITNNNYARWVWRNIA